MAPKHHPTPLSGGDRKALQTELGKARAVTTILATQSAEVRSKAETLLQQADRLLCESWNERIWADGDPIDPSPTIDQVVIGGFPWLEIRCSRCKTPTDIDLTAMKHPPTTFVHDLVSRLARAIVCLIPVAPAFEIAAATKASGMRKLSANGLRAHNPWL
jgi:hypothetical protein